MNTRIDLDHIESALDRSRSDIKSSLEKTMAESGKYYSVEITKRPLDIESDNQLTGDISIGSRRSNRVAEVAFRVVREITDE